MDEPESAAPLVISQQQPSSEFDRPASHGPWNQEDYEPASSLGEHDQAGQIHASLSPFRDHAEPSFSLGGAETRPEPFVARRASDPPASLDRPEQSAIPTQRDLPQHRIEASMPPPAPRSAPNSARAQLDSAAPLSDFVSPTTASIAADEPVRRSPWVNYAAFVIALLLAVAFGLWLTSGTRPEQASSPDPAKSAAVVVKPPEPAIVVAPALPANADTVTEPAQPAAPRAVTTAAPATPRKETTPALKAPSVAPATPPAVPNKSVPNKSPRETIF
jgi:hypothetical protein